MIRYVENPLLKKEDLLTLYHSVHWSSYTKDSSSLLKAVSQSLYSVGAYDNDHLIGLIRVVGDDESIAYIQDVLIKPNYQNQGIGSVLFDNVKNRFHHVRQMVLMSDVDAHNELFYYKQGFVKGANYGLELFVLIK